MSTTPEPTLPHDDETLAGEYVLGLVEGRDRHTVERRLETDRGFADAVERWRLRLQPIDLGAQPLQPSPELWLRIEAALAAQEQRPVMPRGLPLRERVRGWWDSLPVWRGAAFAGALACLVLAVGLIAALDRAGRQPTMVAVLLTNTNVAAAVVHTFADGRVELLPLQSIAVPEGRALEIWTLWDRQVGPRSVGLIDRARSTPLRLDNLPLGTDQLFEITLEPATGSPTGRPTGPIIALGRTAQRL